MKRQAKLNISFEFFPPKTLEAQENLCSSATALAQTAPDFFSVTFGAGGSTRAGTLDAVTLLQKETGISIAPHLSCIGASRQEVIELLRAYQQLGVSRLVALRGDLPSGMGQSGEFRFASELVELIREVTHDHFHIEVAAYPECHPQSKNALNDILNFKKKVEAGADSAITQYFFNPDAYFYFLDYCAEFGISIPIVPGIMPIGQFSKLRRFSETCGAEIPRWLCTRLEAYADDQDSLRQFGLEVVYNLCQRLIEGGAPGLHFYTLNHAEASMELLRMLDLDDQTTRLAAPKWKVL